VSTASFITYYDGITLNAQGEIITPLQAFEQKRTDRVATKALAVDLLSQGSPMRSSYCMP
jgi:hypothetical protein